MASCPQVRLCIGPYTLGEKPLPTEHQFVDESGAVINLTGFMARFIVKEKHTAAVGNFAAAVTDAVNGKVTYTWSGTEFPTAGHYTAEFWVGNGTQRYASNPIDFTVRVAVGTAPAI